MFNTISKHCLLCLRLASYGASMLWSAFIRGGVGWLCLCASQLLFATVVVPLKHRVRVLDEVCLCLLYTGAVTIHMGAHSATSHVQLPQESGFLSPIRWERKRHLQLTQVSFVVPANRLRKIHFLYKGKVCSFKLNKEVMSTTFPPSTLSQLNLTKIPQSQFHRASKTPLAQG